MSFRRSILSRSLLSVRSAQISYEEVLIKERDGELGPRESWPKGAMPRTKEKEAKLRATFEAYGTTLGVTPVEPAPTTVNRKRSAAPELEPQRDVKPKIEEHDASPAATESREREQGSIAPGEESKPSLKSAKKRESGLPFVFDPRRRGARS